MARDFDGTDDDLTSSTVPVSAWPVTIAGWGNPDQTNLRSSCCSITDAAADDKYLGVEFTDNGTIIVSLFNGVQFSFPATTDTYSANTWAHVGVVCSGDSSRFVYLDGVASAEDVTTVTFPTNFDTVSIGVFNLTSTPNFSPMNGELAEWAIWSAALTTPEMSALADGVSPLLIRPASLECYVPIYGLDSPEKNLMGGTFTVVGAVKSPHPRIIMPPGLYRTTPAAAAVAVTGHGLLLGRARNRLVVTGCG